MVPRTADLPWVHSKARSLRILFRINAFQFVRRYTRLSSVSSQNLNLSLISKPSSYSSYLSLQSRQLVQAFPFLLHAGLGTFLIKVPRSKENLLPDSGIFFNGNNPHT